MRFSYDNKFLNCLFPFLKSSNVEIIKEVIKFNNKLLDYEFYLEDFNNKELLRTIIELYKNKKELQLLLLPFIEKCCKTTKFIPLLIELQYSKIINDVKLSSLSLIQKFSLIFILKTLWINEKVEIKELFEKTKEKVRFHCIASLEVLLTKKFTNCEYELMLSTNYCILLYIYIIVKVLYKLCSDDDMDVCCPAIKLCNMLINRSIYVYIYLYRRINT